MADSKALRDIVSDAANIHMDGEALRDRLKSNMLDENAVKADVEDLMKHIFASTPMASRFGRHSRGGP